MPRLLHALHTMDNNITNIEKLKKLRSELIHASQPPTPDRGAIKILRAEISNLCSHTAQSAICPFCGRLLTIPPCANAKTIGCKRCRNVFVYNPFTDAISVSRAPFRQNVQRVDSKWLAIAAVLIILGGICVFLSMPSPNSESAIPVLKGEPAATLDEVQKHLKSLSE